MNRDHRQFAGQDAFDLLTTVTQLVPVTISNNVKDKVDKGEERDGC